MNVEFSVSFEDSELSTSLSGNDCQFSVKSSLDDVSKLSNSLSRLPTIGSKKVAVRIVNCLLASKSEEGLSSTMDIAILMVNRLNPISLENYEGCEQYRSSSVVWKNEMRRDDGRYASEC